MHNAGTWNEVAMNNILIQTVAVISAIVISGLSMMQPASAKPGYVKKCSHVVTSVSVSGPAILINQLKQQAMAKGQSQTGANVNHAGQKQFSCMPDPHPKTVTCTFSARVCTYTKNTKYKPYPPRTFPKPDIAIGPGGSNTFGLAPRRMQVPSISGGAGILRRR